MSVEGWGIGKLGEICSISIGGTPSRANPVYWDVDKSTDNLWVSIRDLNQRVITDTAEYLTDQGLKHSNVKELQSGTVLLSFKLTIGRVAIAGKRLYTNEAIAGLVSPGFAPDFLYYGLQQWDLLKGVDQAIKGATLNKQKLNKIEFNYPKSVEEQAQIAAVLSKIDLAITQTEAIIAKQQRIKTGLMQDLLTKGIDENGNIRSEATHEFKDSAIGRIPLEWEVVTIAEIVNAVDPQPDHRTPPEVADGVPYIGISDFQKDGTIDFDNARKVSLQALIKQRKAFSINEGDFVFGKIGTIGLPRRIPNLDNYALSANVILLKPKETPLFVYWWMVSPIVERMVDGEIHTTSQPAFGIKKIRSLKISKPRPEEQIKIVNLLEKADDKIQQYEKNLNKLRSLKTGLMQDLLTGKVRVTPLLEQEPASR
jgi:type I restriction enzyme, S subunit